ncbi:MAG TPA: hypothetical protein VMT35_04615 [Ignavibacteriaceae bacterium]|nr:hypothetical protein [Ignavibacteriaceae bacterium]
MDEKTALEELQFIRKVIEDTKRNIFYNGRDYIFWGILVIVGMLGMYVLHLSRIYFNYVWIWAGLISIGWIFSIVARNKSIEKQPSTYAGKILGVVWLSAGIAMTTIGFAGPAFRIISPMAISPILSIIIGSAYFVSGVVIEEKWFRNLSFGWWIGGIILFIVTTMESFLIMAFLMLFFQTIPGFLIYKKYKQEINAQS